MLIHLLLGIVALTALAVGGFYAIRWLNRRITFDKDLEWAKNVEHTYKTYIGNAPVLLSFRVENFYAPEVSFCQGVNIRELMQEYLYKYANVLSRKARTEKSEGQSYAECLTASKEDLLHHCHMLVNLEASTEPDGGVSFRAFNYQILEE